jgi:hypothetical protein
MKKLELRKIIREVLNEQFTRSSGMLSKQQKINNLMETLNYPKTIREFISSYNRIYPKLIQQEGCAAVPTPPEVSNILKPLPQNGDPRIIPMIYWGKIIAGATALMCGYLLYEIYGN